MSKHIALSYSRLSTYELCPKKFKASYIDKNYPDESGKACFVKGKKKHSQLENYINFKVDPTIIPVRYDGDVKAASSMVDKLINNGYSISAEHQLAVDLDFNEASWFDKSVMYRAICDFIAIRGDEATIGDWKTGKFRDYDGSKTGQLHLSAAIVFSLYPNINTITAAYFFIEHKQTVMRRFTRDMDLRTPFLESFDTVNNDKTFEPVRNSYCHWCLIKDDCIYG